jgi:DNA-binding response OmpR family regulator
MVHTVLHERGHQVHCAFDGESGVRIIDSGLEPSVVLLDRSLPGWPLSTTLHEMRQRLGSTPVLLFTGQVVTDEERQGVEEVLTKPLSTDELVFAVERWLPLDPPLDKNKAR